MARYGKKAQSKVEKTMRAQTRNLAQRTVGQEGDQPQAGDRDRPVGSAPRRRQGAEAEILFIVEGIVAVARHTGRRVRWNRWPAIQQVGR